MNSSARPAGSDEKPEGGPVKPLLIREGAVPKVGEFPFPWTQDALRDNLLKEALEMRVGGLRAKSEESFSHHHHMLPFWRLCAEETGVYPALEPWEFKHLLCHFFHSLWGAPWLC